MKQRVHAATGKAKADTTLVELERLLGHHFTRPELLTLAITHRSFVYESGETDTNVADPSKDNEQLEFLGDAALGLIAADALCRRFPASREGDLTQLRANVVSRKHLGAVGARLDLGRWLRLGQTAEKNQGRQNVALFANAVEALIAALYLDGGLEPARRFVERVVLADALPELERCIAGGQAMPGGGFSGAVGDHKSALQEFVQAEGLGRPKYILLEESGPDHKRLFRIEVRLDGPGAEMGALAEADGSTKKQAQQDAARIAVAKLLTRVKEQSK